MKTNTFLTPIILLILMLSACGADATATPTGDASLDGIYTAAAMTIFAQQSVGAISTPLPPTPTMIPSATLISGIRTSTPSWNTISSSSSTSGCDSSAYLNDVTITDGTVLTPDESFTKTWSLQNTGTCDWTTSYSIAYYSGSVMSGSATALTDSVSPGGNINASVDLIAPSTAGTYTGYWRLQNASGTSFGEAVYVQIVVSGSTATPTATTTDDDSYTSTPTTAAATSTTAPTTAPTATPTSTPEVTTEETSSS